MVLWRLVDGRLSCEAISETLAEIDGISVEGHLGRSPSDVLPEIGTQLDATITGVFERGRSVVLELGGPTPASPEVDRSYRAEYYPVWDERRELVEYVVGLVTETTALERSRSTLRLLDMSGEVLAATLDARRALTQLAELLVSGLADFVVVRLASQAESDVPEVFLVRHADPQVEARIRDVIERFSLPVDSPIGPPAVLAGGRPELLADFEAARATFARDEEHERELVELGIHSLLTVPLSVSGRSLGAITLGRIERSARFDEEDLSTMVEIARRAGIAVDNAATHAKVVHLASAADALEQLDEGVVMTGPQGLVRRMNAAAESMLGVRREDAMGRMPVDINDCFAMVAASAVAVEPGSRVSLATSVRCPGHPDDRWVSVTRTSSRLGTVYTLHDVTVSYDLERVTSEFVATVSHELRTPLTVLQGAAQTLLDLGPSLDTAVHGQLLEAISSQSQRLSRIVAEILTSQQLDIGSITLHPALVDIAGVTHDAVGELAPIAPDGIELADETPDEPLVAQADVDALRQVLGNLLDNAIRYSPDGGRIVVSAEAVDDRVAIRVADEGVGIPFVDRERVFDKFVRLDPEHRHVRGGTGLGLYVSRELMRRMEGDITISDGRGRGTVFTVMLPR